MDFPLETTIRELFFCGSLMHRDGIAGVTGAQVP